MSLSLILVPIIIGLVVIDIHGHGIDVVAANGPERAAGRLVGQEKRPAVRPLAGDGAGGIGRTRKRNAFDLHLAIGKQRSNPIAQTFSVEGRATFQARAPPLIRSERRTFFRGRGLSGENPDLWS